MQSRQWKYAKSSDSNDRFWENWYVGGSDSGATELVISFEFTKKQKFKLKKIERSIYVRNINSSFNKEKSIEHTIEVNIYYEEYRERMEINMIWRQN